MTALRRVPWNGAIAVVLPLTILLLAGGSSSVQGLREVATAGRWAGLAALAVLAVAQALVQGRRPWALPATWVAAAAFAALALESAVWSVAPRLTVERTFTFGVVFLAAAALALGAPRADIAAARTLAGVVVGVGAVAVASLVVLAVSRHDAVQAATTGAGWRFQGIGENPNAVAMLLSLGLPIAVWWSLAHRGETRLFGAALVVLFVGELAVSGSRGALIAAVGGTLVTALACIRAWRARAIAAAAIVAGALACVGIAKLPSPQPVPLQTPGAAPATPATAHQPTFALEDEIGFPPQGAYRPPVRRTIFGSSGRAQAWRGALDQGVQRPVAGYGFGTEERVFVDRYYGFESSYTENGYLGLFLQVGGAGLALFLGLLVALLWCGVRVLRSPSRNGPAAAATGVLVGAMLVELSQTGFLSVGNIAAASIWISVLSLPLLARDARRPA